MTKLCGDASRLDECAACGAHSIRMTPTFDSRAGDDLTPRERIARVVAWEHFGIAWHHMEKQSHADVLAMVDRMLDSRAGDAVDMPEYAPDDISHLEGLASYLDGVARDKGRAGLPASKSLFEEIAKRLREYDVIRNAHPAPAVDAPTERQAALTKLTAMDDEIGLPDERLPISPNAVDAVPAGEVEQHAAARLAVMADYGRIDAAYGDFSHPAATMIDDVRKLLAALSHGEGRK